MKNILVPVDFSSIAENALLYAIGLCQLDRSSILLLHVLIEEGSESTQQEKRREAEKKMKGLCVKIEHAGKIEYKYQIVMGDPVKEIIHVANKEKTGMIVMGTKGESNLESAIFGSNAANVINTAHCPVLTIPEGTKFKLPNKITFATDYHPSDLNVLQFIIDHIKAPRAQLNILHVAMSNEDPSIEKKHMEEMIKEVESHINYNNLSFQLKAGDDLDNELMNYLASDAADLFVTSTRQRSFWEKYFNEGVTRNIIQHAGIPVLAFHHKLNSAVKLF
ncbi:MAG TPA: universal stress protein [Bacteroidia bacterium]|nr:universal stress protein [Bacteroidia bacterium]